MNKKTADYNFIQILGYVFVGLVALFCMIPFLLIVSGSISTESEIIKNGFSIFPRKLSFDAYKLVFVVPKTIINAYKVSFIVTLTGVAFGLLLTAVAGYVLMRKDFKYRNTFAFIFYFSSIFSGGMIPAYILMVNYLHLKDSVLALILPGAVSAWNIFLMRNFMSSIPESIAESAKIDGANDAYIFYKLYLPLSKPGLATIGLFIGLGHWNSWFGAMLYISKKELFPLQYLLYKMLSSVSELQQSAMGNAIIPDMPGETLKMAMAVVATGPIIFLYPFVQRYFISGLTVGSVKG